MPLKKQQLIWQIEELESQLENLKIELEKTEETEFKIGEKVRIRNPKHGQPTRGTIYKLHPNSQTATVITRIQVRGEQDIEIKTVRMYKNLERI